MSKIPKNRRQHLVARLLSEFPVTNQPQLVDLLAERGVDATQATVSRDLEELAAVKVRMPGLARPVYAIAEPELAPPAPVDHLRRVLGEWVVEVASSANLVVIRTPPGSAHVVASAIDRTRVEGVVGTVAGDDTVLVIADEASGGASLAKQFAEMSGQPQ
ncbi:MAG: arginine repressor [Acidimicrobiales bacterium]